MKMDMIARTRPKHIRVEPDLSQLEHEEQRAVDHQLRDLAGKIRNTLDLAKMPMRTLHRQIENRFDRELDRKKIHEAFLQLAEAARQGAALTKG
ncbi:MAG: hypothetical protein KIS92_20015 [Planctomycetota bacterium]|nr:hypothetical protein [Planctomycetota bacterium]